MVSVFCTESDRLEFKIKVENTDYLIISSRNKRNSDCEMKISHKTAVIIFQMNRLNFRLISFQPNIIPKLLLVINLYRNYTI